METLSREKGGWAEAAKGWITHIDKCVLTLYARTEIKPNCIIPYESPGEPVMLHQLGQDQMCLLPALMMG